AVEAEGHPAVAALAQLNAAGLLRRSLPGVEDKESPAFLIADPEFLFVRRKRGAVCAMRNRLAAGQHAVGHVAGSQIDDIESDVFAEADIGVAVPAVDGKREHAAFADTADVAHQRVVAGPENPEVGL